MKKTEKIAAALFCMAIMVSMTFIDANSNSMIIDADLRVLDNKFIADVGEEIHFNAFFSSGPWQTLVYFFHDGTEPLQTTQTNVTHAFPLEGKYLVTLMAVGVGGISDLDTVEITIINSQPSASILMPSAALEDQNVTLCVNDPIDTPNDLDILQYRWILGDGNVKTGAEIQYAWRYAGTYTVTLQVIDDQLAMNYTTAEITISNIPPSAEFEILTEQDANGDYLALEDTTLEFIASATMDSPSDYKNLRYYWDFDDGTVGRGREIHHTYYESGLYTVNLLVLDNDGESSSIEKNISIYNTPPTVDLTESNIILEEGETYTFFAESNDTITDYQRLLYTWNFGELGWRASHTWTDNCNDSIAVIVEDPEGLIDTDYVDIEVLNVPPQASISMAYIAGNITLKAAGTPNNTIELRVYGNEQVVTNFTLDRIPGDPKSQAITIPFLFDLSKTWRIETSYKDVIEGANPTWLTFTLPDGSIYQEFHNFVVDHEDSWVWEILPHYCFFSWPVTFNGTIFDPSSDSVTGEVKFNSISILNISHVDDGSWPVEFPFEVTVNPTDGSVLEVTAEDDDGGTAYTCLEIRDFGQMVIQYLAPRIAISATTQTMEDMPVDISCLYLGPYEPETLQYIWSFGDGVSATGANVSHVFQNSGDYLVQLMATDPTGRSTTRGQVIHVENFIPIVEIMGIFESVEDYELDFEPQIYETETDEAELRYFWTFGDGAVAPSCEVSHSYAYSDNYSLNLNVIDNNGQVGTQTITVTIHDEPPIVDGPYGFEAVEGSTLIADISVYDSTVDEPNLQYLWEYDSITSQTPIFTTRGDDEIFNVMLTIIDPGTISISDNISLAFINEPPVVVASNQILYGGPSSLELKAFALDSYLDTPELTYEWFINGEAIPDGQGESSSITYTFTETRSYNGYVLVTDDSNYTVSSEFTILVVLDSDGDGLEDALETIYGTNASATDSDGDYLSDSYEIQESKTNPNAWDSDGDGLCDGFDPSPNVLTGELMLGTDPWNPDTDNDNITDGDEVLGWTIQVREWVNGWDPANPEETKSRNVTSNPLLIDTDGDGLTDWQEKEVLYYDPGRSDTDGDGTDDWDESGMGAAFDYDNDGLSDSLERTPIITYVPLKYLFNLYSDGSPESSWTNTEVIEGEIENTQVNDANSWFGQNLTYVSPQPVTFTGVINSISTIYNTFILRFNVSANQSDAEFQIWDGLNWVTLNTFNESATYSVVLTTDQANFSQWIHDGTLQFRIESGFDEELDEELLSYNSYINIYYAQVVGIIKYTLNSDESSGSTWSNTAELQGALTNTFFKDTDSWFGRRKLAGYPLTVGFEGVFDSITPSNHKLTVHFRVSADASDAQFLLWDGANWVSCKTYDESTTDYIEILLEDEYPGCLDDGTLKFRILGGYNKEGWWLIPEYDSFIEIYYAVVEEITTEITTLSDPILPDTDNDGLNDWEEYYPGKDGFITALRNNDTDNDALLDSAESFSITKEYGKREQVTITKTDVGWSPSTIHEFYFTAIIGGKAQNATLLIGFSSQTDLKINLVRVEVAGITVVEEIEPELEEPEGGIDGTIFYKSYDISQNTTIFSGEWKLTLDIEPLDPGSINVDDHFSVLLEDFKVDVTQRLNPNNPDCDKDGLFDGHELNAAFSGWVTNPKAWDSDGDYWNDHDEIRKYNTNPLSLDTDGDGVNDPYDRDPLFNLMLKLNIYEGHFHNAYFTRRLAVVLKIEDQATATPGVVASGDPITRGWWIFTWTAYRTANFAAAGFTEYYFDIPDQRTAVQIGVELWIVTILWDTKILSKTYSYSLGTGLDANPSPIETLIGVHGDWVRFAVQTIGMKRVNTIAITAEGNFLDGHYPTIERFTTLILGVNEPQGPFVEGVNVIVIPVSLFLHTQLHAMWEHENIPPELTDASASGFNASFYGLDSDAESVSQHVEGLIVKGLEEEDYVTLQEAWAILEYLLNNETGQPLYSYYVCNESGEVERLGLAKDILELIPFDAQTMENDDTGPMPKGFWDWLIGIFITILFIILLAVLAPFLFLIALIAAIIYIGVTLLGPLLAAAALAVLKLIILVYVFLMLAITLLCVIIGFLITIIFLSIITISNPEVLNWGLIWYEINYPSKTGRFEISVVFEYSSLLDLTIPCLKFATYKDSQLVFESLFTFGIPVELNADTKISSNFMSSSQESQDNLETFGVNSLEDSAAYNYGRTLAGILALIAMIGIASNPFGWVTVAFTLAFAVVATILVSVFIVLTALALYFIDRGGAAGYGLGLFHAGLIILAPPITYGPFEPDAVAAYSSAAVYGLLKDAFFPEYQDDVNTKAFFSLLLAPLSAGLYNGKVKRDTFQKGSWLLLSVIFMGLGLAIAFLTLILTS